MMYCITIFLIAFLWLLVETDFLRVRLPTGYAKSTQYIEALSQMLDTKLMEIDRYLVMKPTILQLPEFCQQTKFQQQFTGKYKPHWTNYKRVDSYQIMTIGRAKIKLNATLPNLHDIISEVQKVQTEKHKPKQITSFHITEKKYTYLDKSSQEKYGATTEPLCGKEWLESHKDDYQDFEPTIDLEVDGKEFHVNGNYKPGLINQCMGTKIRKTRKLVAV